MMRQRTSTRKTFSVERLEDRLCLSNYAIFDLVPPTGWYSSGGNAVNDAGWVAGEGADSSSFVSAAIWRRDNTGRVVTTALPEVVARASRANDINNSLQVVGFSDTTFTGPDPQTPNTPHAVLWQLDAQGMVTGLTDLSGLSNYPYTEAEGINNLGQAVGSGTNSNSQHTAFLWDGTNGMRDLNTLLPVGSGWLLTDASDINDNGQIAGSGVHNGTSRGFRFDLGTSTIIDLGVLPGGTASGATAINGLGHVVGAAQTRVINAYGFVNSDAFLWANNALTDLGTLGNAGSTALGVNGSDTAVGVSLSTKAHGYPFYDARATLWSNGVNTDLNKLIPSSPKWTLQRASDINNSGQIVGSGQVGTGTTVKTHGFLMIPTAANLTAASTGMLGMASGQMITLNANAPGWDWGADSTTHSDAELRLRDSQSESIRMNQVSMDEMGQVMSLRYDHQGAVAETQAVRQRHTPMLVTDAALLTQFLTSRQKDYFVVN